MWFSMQVVTFSCSLIHSYSLQNPSFLAFLYNDEDHSYDEVHIYIHTRYTSCSTYCSVDGFLSGTTWRATEVVECLRIYRSVCVCLSVCSLGILGSSFAAPKKCCCVAKVNVKTTNPARVNLMAMPCFRVAFVCRQEECHCA